MLHIIKQYRQLFFAFILNNLNNAPDSSISFKDELSKDLQDKELSLDEAKALLARLELGEKLRYTKDSAKTLVDSLGVAGTDTWINSKSFKEKLKSIVENAENERGEIIDESKKGLKKEKIRLNQDQKTFINIDKKIGGLDNANKGQIMAYQSFLAGVGYFLGKTGPNHDGVDGISGKKTKDAYNEYKAGLEKVNFKGGKVKYGKEAIDVINKLTVVDKYLGAFNKAYGGKGETLSRHNGIIMQLARVFDIADNDVERLYSQLESDKEFKEILNELNGKLDKKSFGKELGLDDNSEKFDSGVKRTLIIALVSLIISGGSGIALELGAINYGENLHKGPKIEKILKAFGINVDMKKDMRNMYISKETTVSGVEEILDILNNSNMDTANLKRFMKEIYQPNWFQDTFGIFLPDGYEKVEELIKKFEKTGKTEDAKNAVQEIYRVAKEAVNNAEKEYYKAQVKYNNIPADVMKEAKDPASIMKGYDDDDFKMEVTNASFAIRKYKSTKKELLLARQGLSRLGEVTKRHTNLDAKYDSIIGKKFDIKRARKIEGKIDNQMGINSKDLKKINTKELYSKQSFAKGVDINNVSNKKYMEDMYNSMKETTINGKTSVLSGVIRGIEQHYGITFTPEEFKEAFINTAEKTDSKYILSNLGRDKNQKFQGTIDTSKGKGKLFKINLNGTDVFFRDKCTNIVTVVADFVTTVETTNSIPLIVYGKTGLDNAWKNGGNNPSNTDGNPNSRPDVTEPVKIPSGTEEVTPRL